MNKNIAENNILEKKAKKHIDYVIKKMHKKNNINYAFTDL